MSKAAPSPSPLDRALNHLLAGAPEAGLAELLPWLEARGEPAAVLAAGQVLALAANEGRPVAATAERVLRAAARIATRARSFGCAAAACGELVRRGADATAEYEALGAAFSGRPEPTQAIPPSLSEGDCQPVRLDWLELVDRVETICEQLAEGPVAPVTPGPTELLCSKLEPAELVAFAQALSYRVVPAGELIIEEGNPGRAAYFLARGELEVFRGKDAADAPGQTSGVQPAGRTVLARLGAGSLFGEMALLSRSPRAASVVALRPSLVLRGSKRALDEAATQSPRLGRTLAAFCRRRMIDNLVRTSVVLRPLPAAQRTALLERFQAHTFDAGEVVIAQGQEGAGLHLVASGALRVVAEEQGESTHLATLATGDVVGEVGLVLRRPAGAAVVADCPSVTLHLPAQDFHALIKEHPVLLAQLYELAVQREDETRSLLAQQAQDASDWVLF
jgi:cAMP-dependent protein kinase regulator